MPPRKPHSAAPNDSASLREELVELRQQVQLLSTIIDELREEVSWVARNGIPPHADTPACPVLKRMALNPAAADWNERLDIERGTTAARSADAGQPVAIADPPEPTAVLLPVFEPGDTVEFADEGIELYGEIVSVDPALNEATVMLLPSEEQVVVTLDRLIPIEANDEVEPPRIPVKADSKAKNKAAPRSKPPAGKLFAEPGDQPQLF